MIPIIIVSLLAGVVGYFLLREGDDTRGMGTVAERVVEEGMAYDRVNVEEELFSCPKCGGREGSTSASGRGPG